MKFLTYVYIVLLFLFRQFKNLLKITALGFSLFTWRRRKMHEGPNDAGCSGLWNVDKLPPNHTAQRPRNKSLDKLNHWNRYVCLNFQSCNTRRRRVRVEWSTSGRDNRSLCTCGIKTGSKRPASIDPNRAEQIHASVHRTFRIHNLDHWMQPEWVNEIKPLWRSVFYVVTPRNLIEVFRFRSPDIGGNKSLWNVGKLLPVYLAQQRKIQPSSYTSSWEPEI